MRVMILQRMVVDFDFFSTPFWFCPPPPETERHREPICYFGPEGPK